MLETPRQRTHPDSHPARQGRSRLIAPVHGSHHLLSERTVLVDELVELFLRGHGDGADVCKPLPIDGPFDSAALNGVIHCLPGPLSRKADAVANVAAVLGPTGVLFGASILGTSGRHTWLSRRALYANNRRGTFDNLTDTEEGLRQILEASFERLELETVGSMAIFAATNPRSNSPTVTTP